MNYVVLQEGESMFLGPNVPHAYIFGGMFFTSNRTVECTSLCHQCGWEKAMCVCVHWGTHTHCIIIIISRLRVTAELSFN
jgi:hypothetical protein